MSLFAKDHRARVMGVADCTALCIVYVAAVFCVWHGQTAAGVVSLLWCGVWTMKAFMLCTVTGSWFPARFGMNAAGVYDTWWWWAIGGNLLWGITVLWFGVTALDGDVMALLACTTVAVSMGRVTFSHGLAGWMASRRMTMRTSGGE